MVSSWFWVCFGAWGLRAKFQLNTILFFEDLCNAIAVSGGGSEAEETWFRYGFGFVLWSGNFARYSN